jgi:hypothetical protein
MCMKSLVMRIEYYERKTRQITRLRGRHRLRRLARLTLYKCAIDTAIVRYIRKPWHKTAV